MELKYAPSGSLISPPTTECKQDLTRLRRCVAHDMLPLYPNGMCLEGISQKKIREPNCHCNPPTIWEYRKLDLFYKLTDTDDEGKDVVRYVEQRTCLVCIATLTRELPEGVL